MKKNLLILAAVLMFAASANPQFRKDNFEVGISTSLGSLSATNANPWLPDYSTYYFTFLSGFAGYYLFDGWSIEPEFGIFAVENNRPAQFIIGNLSYTKMRKNSPFAFFGKIGYGLSNSVILTYSAKPLLINPDNFDTKIISVGMGVKYLIDYQIALRGEFNYKFQSRSITVGTVSDHTTSDSKYETFSFVLGASFLF